MGDALRPLVDYSVQAETDDVRVAHLQKVDSTIALGTFEGVSMVASFQSGGLEYEHVYTDDAHMYGHSKCFTFGPCEAANVVGSSCNSGAGYCYEDSAGTLQCGRTASTHNRFSNVEVGTYDPIVRCPRGAAAVNGLPANSQVVVKRLLIAGCMILGDASYSASAEVHVPQMCTSKAHYKKGCLFPGASNYAPGSVQAGFCQYVTHGCTNPAALNYNSKATADPQNTCIMPVVGCTLPQAGYANVDADTPGYKGLFVGVPLRGVGETALPSYGTVKNRNPQANVLSGCEVVIEGCTDEEAVNYDSRANMNSNSWCVPKVPGCMMDKTTTNFKASFTVHRKKECILYHVGCMDALAINYDSHATVEPEGSCTMPVPGCLDKEALNFGCADQGLEACSSTADVTVSTAVTVHSVFLCTFNEDQYVDPGDSREGTYTKSLVIPMEGDVSDYTNDMMKGMKQGICETLGIPIEVEEYDRDDERSCKQRVTLTISAASVVATGLITADSYAELISVTETLSSDFSSPAQINAIFTAVAASLGLPAPPSVDPTAIISFGTEYTGSVSMDDYRKKQKRGGIIGGAVGGSFGGIMFLGLMAYLYKKRQAGGSYDKQVVPA